MSLFLYIQVFGKEKESTNRGSHLSEEERHELKSLMWQIRSNLNSENYGLVLDHAVLPKGNIEVIVKLESNKIDKKTKEDIQQIATDVIKQNDFDSDIFQFNITSFYSSEKEGNHISQRLSYNDLMGDIMLSLNELGYDVAVQGEVSSDKNVIISLDYHTISSMKTLKKKYNSLQLTLLKNIILKLKYFNLT